jgi:hypothetical protein
MFVEALLDPNVSETTLSQSEYTKDSMWDRVNNEVREKMGCKK